MTGSTIGLTLVLRTPMSTTRQRDDYDFVRSDMYDSWTLRVGVCSYMLGCIFVSAEMYVDLPKLTNTF